MDLGSFSISLSVRDLAASRDFYATLGFEIIDGDAAENWLILRNGDSKIGIFQDKFEGNLLTFAPSDVRAIQKRLREHGIELLVEADESTTGPAHIVLRDPDGNVLLLDQL